MSTTFLIRFGLQRYCQNNANRLFEATLRAIILEALFCPKRSQNTASLFFFVRHSFVSLWDSEEIPLLERVKVKLHFFSLDITRFMIQSR